MAGIPRLRDYKGPALLSYGFRPFFLFGSLYAGLAVLAWLPVLNGQLELASTFVPRDWHVHEMLYGFVPAVVTGFLLTAIPNWTGRLPLQGLPLLTLLAVWMAGRVAVGLSALTGWIAATAIDGAFLLLVAAAAAREIVTGKNWGNLKIVAIVGILAAGNIAFHLEAHFSGSADFSVRAGVAAIILLISLVGGRVVPSFTRNWLARGKPGRMPSPFGRFDVGTVAASALALMLWIAAPDASCYRSRADRCGDNAAGPARPLGGRAHVFRPARPCPSCRLRLCARRLCPDGLRRARPHPATAGIHAWTGGAVGTMTLAVMTRASLGHTGRELSASVGTQAIYTLVVVGALARICASVHPEWSGLLLVMSGVLWAAAFVGFVILYGSLLCRPRLGHA